MASFDEAVPPGKVGKITAEIHTEKFRGPIEKSITVRTNDPTKASIVLRMAANVIGSIEILPQAYLMFPTNPGWDYESRMLLRKEESEEGGFAVTDLRSSAPWLITKTRRVEAAEPARDELPEARPGDWILEVSIADDAPKGQSGQTVSFKTGLKREPELVLPVSVMMYQAIQVQPANLVVPVPAGAPEATGKIAVLVRPGLAKGPLTASVTPDVFDVEIEREGPRRFAAKVHWKANGENTPRSGIVTLSTAEESHQVHVRILEKPPAPAPAPPG